MKPLFMVLYFLGTLTTLMALDGRPDEEIILLKPEQKQQSQALFLPRESSMRISVVGQGVAPTITSSPAQAYALAKRAATVDAYRLLAEQVQGVHVEGKDMLKNMMVRSSTVNLTVTAMIRNATVVETKFENGLCELEMEITLNYNQLN